jgi:hypothetical protein
MQYRVKTKKKTLIRKCLLILTILVRFCADYRIKPHAPPFKQIPANSVKFRPCDYTAQAEYLSVSVDQISLNTHSL